jgi:hypothetical protein
MKRVGPFSLEGWLVFLFVGVVILGVTTCNARRDGRRAERVAHLSDNAYKASLAGIAARRSTDSVISAGAVIRQRVISLSADNRRLSAQLGAVLDANDSILRLPPDSSDVVALRAALQRTTEVARLYRDSADVLLGSVERMLASQSAERQAWLAEREANTKLLAAKDSVISALRESEQCRILFIRCPSRVQSVGIGAGIVLLLLL